MNLDMDNPAVKLISIKGVWWDLSMVSAWSARQRGSKFIEPIDLVKAIYIVDLEHVSRYWNDWLNYETFVTDIPLAEGKKDRYINRFYQALQLQLEMREVPGQFVPLASPSSDIQEIVFAAQRLAQARGGEEEVPSSCDILFCACSHDPGLSEALQQAGLQLEKLAIAVGKPLGI